MWNNLILSICLCKRVASYNVNLQRKIRNIIYQEGLVTYV